MTAEEIKKALTKCSVDSCKDCPYDNTGLYCCANLKRDALVHITEQEKEIERLKEEKKQAQIEILSKSKERIKTAIDTYFNLDGGGYYLAEDAINDIDEFIKEAEGE